MKSLQAELTELMTEIEVTEQRLIATGEAVIDATERLESMKFNTTISAMMDNTINGFTNHYKSISQLSSSIKIPRAIKRLS